MGLSPFYDSVFYLFITLCNKFHEVHLGNLYMTTNFSHLSYTHHNPVTVQRVCRTDGWGITTEVLQTEFHDKKPVDRVQ